MIYEITMQLRVPDWDTGLKWYKTLLKRNPDFVPHDGFAEWELIPGCWLQLAEGTPAEGSGPLRLGVHNIESEQNRIVKELRVDSFEIYSTEGVPVKWGTFSDPWGNRVGIFEYISETEKQERIKTIFG